MKVHQLFEEQESNIVEFVQQNCTKWIAETDKPLWRGIRKSYASKIPFPNLYGTEAQIWTVNKRRDPMTSNRWFHEALDAEFKKHFGVGFRSEAVFATPFKDTAGIYGEQFVMLPIGDYEYVWSPIVSDATFDLQDIHMGGYLLPQFRNAHIHGAAYDKRLEKVGKLVLKVMLELELIVPKADSEMSDKEYGMYVDQVYGDKTETIMTHLLQTKFEALDYRQDGVRSNKKSEVMVSCDKYLLVNGKPLQELKKAGIIK